MSFAFLVAYSYATQRFSRAKLFNIIISVFLVFFAGFAWFYPQHHVSSRMVSVWRGSCFSSIWHLAACLLEFSSLQRSEFSAPLDSAGAAGMSGKAKPHSLLLGVTSVFLPSESKTASAGKRLCPCAHVRHMHPLHAFLPGRRSCTSTAWRRTCRRGCPPAWRAASA